MAEKSNAISDVQELAAKLKQINGLEELSAELMDRINRVFPYSTNIISYVYGTFENDKNMKILKNFFKVYGKNEDLFSLLPDPFGFDDYPEEIFKSTQFKVNGHNYFFHGTSYENYEKILQTGYLKFTDYLDGLEHEKAEGDYLKFRTFETGKVFLTDDFKTSIFYATRDSMTGVVLCLDLHDFSLESLYERTGRQFVSQKVVPIERIKGVYLINVIENNIQVQRMEATK